ncbi:hypothetical protein PRZ48_003718 [Zasmidium cellare]|uniref:Alpha/beta hydrolase fold-3 domain-containing protein n=1 Tax=Zasmidium cellare TaxID=395010 RepID=A0ABR0EXF0_ZASCE|nr:hypothetical protein PRZ48_003718 [Zasmidium cellare]
MAPSQESQALAQLFKTIAANFPSEPNHFLERCVYDQVHQAAAEPTGVTYENTVAAGRPCLWIRPENASPKHAMLFMHGGGFSFGSPNGHRKMSAHLAKACNVAALSVDYRLAPENPYPAGIDDCVNAYKFLLEQGFKPEHIVVAGDSCGGGLSASVPLSAQKQGLPLPGAVVSLSPSYDLTNDLESMKTNNDVDVLQSEAFVAMLGDRFTNGDQALKKDPIVSPLYADLDGLPPHWISCGGYDMLLDSGKKFAEKAKAAGVEVVLEIHEGQQHVMEFMAGKAPEANESIRRIGEWVQGKIGSQGYGYGILN